MYKKHKAISSETTNPIYPRRRAYHKVSDVNPSPPYKWLISIYRSPSSLQKKKEKRGGKKAKRNGDDDTREAGIIRGDTLTEIVLDVSWSRNELRREKRDTARGNLWIYNFRPVSFFLRSDRGKKRRKKKIINKKKGKGWKSDLPDLYPLSPWSSSWLLE